MSDEDSGTGVGKQFARASSSDSVAESITALWQSLRSAIDQALELVALEARFAAISLAGIVALGVFVGASLLATWMLLAAAGAVWLVGRTGLGWASALLMVMLLTLGLIALACLAIQSLSRNLEFRLTRRRLISKSGDTSNAPNHPTKT